MYRGVKAEYLVYSIPIPLVSIPQSAIHYFSRLIYLISIVGYDRVSTVNEFIYRLGLTPLKHYCLSPMEVRLCVWCVDYSNLSSLRPSIMFARYRIKFVLKLANSIQRYVADIVVVL